MEKLKAALADPSKFGMAKSLFMKGREAGFDMDSKEGVEAWMRLMQSQPLPAALGLPSFGPSRAMNPAVARSKKNQRKNVQKGAQEEAMTPPPAPFDLEQGLIELPGAPARSIWAFTCPTPECTCRTAIVLSAPGARDALAERGRPVSRRFSAGLRELASLAPYAAAKTLLR